MSTTLMQLIIGITFMFFLTQNAISNDYAEFQSKELKCIIGNNAAMGEHNAGYNGIFHLSSIHQPAPIFVPAYAGLNLEHVFHTKMNLDDRQEFFEPRNAPMTFTKIDERTALLHQPATPHTGLESKTTFQLVDPYYLDMEWICTPTKDVFEGGSFGLFWASYINGPEDKSIYFLRGSLSGIPVWQQFCTQLHNRDSTVRGLNDAFRFPFPDTFFNQTLFASFSNVEFREPFYYGRFHNMVLIYLFQSSQIIRLAHSPSGGGNTPSGGDTNPAWDFQMIVPNAEAGKEYTLRMRAVYKQWIDRSDVVKEYQMFQNSQ